MRNNLTPGEKMLAPRLVITREKISALSIESIISANIFSPLITVGFEQSQRQLKWLGGSGPDRVWHLHPPRPQRLGQAPPHTPHWLGFQGQPPTTRPVTWGAFGRLLDDHHRMASLRQRLQLRPRFSDWIHDQGRYCHIYAAGRRPDSPADGLERSATSSSGRCMPMARLRAQRWKSTEGRILSRKTSAGHGRHGRVLDERRTDRHADTRRPRPSQPSALTHPILMPGAGFVFAGSVAATATSRKAESVTAERPEGARFMDAVPGQWIVDGGGDNAKPSKSWLHAGMTPTFSTWDAAELRITRQSDYRTPARNRTP